ncbi:MAG: hypothetical protein EA401_10355 [Planctomycetota bacterium]|nr:MAG: hypothetical protein EA401_10355 [Planctomycetota bacterium]
MPRATSTLCLLATILLIAACGQDAPSAASESAAPAGDGLHASPDNGQSAPAPEHALDHFFVLDTQTQQQLRSAAHCVSLLSDWQDNGEPVTVTARIGGRADPFVNGHAVMLVSTSDAGDACASCRSCDTDSFTALVQLSDEEHTPLRTSLRGVHGLASGTDILIHGHIMSMDGGRPLIDASAVALLP